MGEFKDTSPVIIFETLLWLEFKPKNMYCLFESICNNFIRLQDYTYPLST